MLLSAAQSLPAQQLSEIDFSRAHVSVAGPQSFYVRGLVADGERFSVLVRPSDGGVCEVERVVGEDENIVPPQTLLDLASVRRVDESTVEIDGIVLGDEVYSGRLRVGPDFALQPIDGFGAGDPENVNERRARGLAAAGLGFGPEIDRLERENRRLSTTLRDLRSENEYLRGEVDRLARRVAQLEAEGVPADEQGALVAEAQRITASIDELSAQLSEVESRLSRQISDAGATSEAGPYPRPGGRRRVRGPDGTASAPHPHRRSCRRARAARRLAPLGPDRGADGPRSVLCQAHASRPPAHPTDALPLLGPHPRRGLGGPRSAPLR
jgi:hypothetical protein